MHWFFFLYHDTAISLKHKGCFSQDSMASSSLCLFHTDQTSVHSKIGIPALTGIEMLSVLCLVSVKG